MQKIKKIIIKYKNALLPTLISIILIMLMHVFISQLSIIEYIGISTLISLMIFIMHFFIFVKPRWDDTRQLAIENIKQVIQFVTIFEKFLNDKKPKQIYVSKEAADMLIKPYCTWYNEKTHKDEICKLHIDYDLEGYSFKELPDSDIIKTIKDFYI